MGDAASRAISGPNFHYSFATDRCGGLAKLQSLLELFRMSAGRDCHAGANKSDRV